jgi:ADP-ribosylglycohydrolase
VHDVLDARDLVPDEAEQLSLSGYAVGTLLDDARNAAAADDLAALSAVAQQLAALKRAEKWADDEPDDDSVLLDLAAKAERIDVDAQQLPARILGAWLGRTVGNTLGKPVEGLRRGQLETYLRAAGQWPQTGYLPLLDVLPEGVPALHPSASTAAAGRFSDVPRDDDIDWTILALHVLEKHGRGFTTEQVAATWLDRVPFTQTFTAERAAYRNLIRGLRPPQTATVDNPYREWIGALIRGDAFGYVSPGDPGDAARLALVDARLSHTANGKYGEMWAAALVASALSVDSAEEALTSARSVLPPRSRLAVALDGVAALHRCGAGHVAALDWIDDALASYPWVHTVNNAALIATGLLWGDDFMQALGITISGGRDTDSNGATVGSVFGALHGMAAIPAGLVGSTHVHVRSAVRDFDRVTVDELARRTLRLAQEHARAAHS